MSAIAAVRMSLRDLRLTPVRLWLLAVALAMASLTAVNVFSARLVQGIERQAVTLLGADLVLESTRAPDASYSRRADELGLAAAVTVTFPSVVLHEATPLLVQVKAVSKGYPLRGELETRTTVEAPARKGAERPAPGEAWASATLPQRMSMRVGDMLQLGNGQFRLARIVDFEPDGGADVFQFAPRVMIAAEDLPATGLLTPASRARYRFLVAGEGAALREFKAALEPRLHTGEKLLSLGEARPELRDPLERTQRYLGLAGLLTAAFAGVAMYLAVRLYAREQRLAAALLRSLGASRRRILARYALQLILIGALGAGAGVLAGLAVQAALGALLGRIAGVALGAISWSPLLLSLAWVAALAVLFNFAELIRLTRTPPARLLREDPLQTERVRWGSLAGLLIVMATLAAVQSGNPRLAIIGVAGLGGLLAAQALAAAALIRTAGAIARRQPALAVLSHYRRRGLLLSVTLGATLTLGLVLTFVKDTLIDEWQRQIPPTAPNHFLINIQPSETGQLREFLNARGIEGFELYPMGRGRLIEHNGRAVSPENYANPRAQRLADREFNLSASASLPADNRIESGAWFDADATAGLSIEKGIAETLGLAMGDELVFDVAGDTVRDRITSLRRVEWESLRPNFFVFLAPRALDKLPRTFITSIHLSESGGALIAELVKAFPAVTVIDVRAIFEQVRRVLQLGSAMILVVFGLTLAVSLAVLGILLLAQREERTQEMAVHKALGATTVQLRRHLLLEFGWLGAATGLASGLIAEAATWMLVRRLFEADYELRWATLLFGVIAAWLMLGAGVLLVLRGVAGTSPMQLFRRL